MKTVTILFTFITLSASYAAVLTVTHSNDSGPGSVRQCIGDDVVDMDESELNNQWVDTTGDVSHTGIRCYETAAYNYECPAYATEGPW